MTLTIRIGSREERQKAIAKAAELLQCNPSNPSDEEFESLIGAIADYDDSARQADNDAPQHPAPADPRTRPM